jgi:transposase
MSGIALDARRSPATHDQIHGRWGAGGTVPLFDEMYAEDGRPSIPPERLLKASLLMSLYSVRSERAFCEQLDHYLLYRWFLGMNMVEPNFDR